MANGSWEDAMKCSKLAAEYAKGVDNFTDYICDAVDIDPDNFYRAVNAHIAVASEEKYKNCEAWVPFFNETACEDVTIASVKLYEVTQEHLDFFPDLIGISWVAIYVDAIGVVHDEVLR